MRRRASIVSATWVRIGLELSIIVPHAKVLSPVVFFGPDLVGFRKVSEYGVVGTGISAVRKSVLVSYEMAQFGARVRGIFRVRRPTGQVLAQRLGFRPTGSNTYAIMTSERFSLPGPSHREEICRWSVGDRKVSRQRQHRDNDSASPPGT